jgi:lipoprotein-anchoring transpeptidase ErfK/SrfK
MTGRGQVRRCWRIGLTVVCGICLLFTAGAAGGATQGLPAQRLTHQTTHRATATAVDAGSTKPGTVPARAGNTVVSSLGLQGGAVVYGVGMPVPVVFNAPVPDSAKADVERRLSVRSDPPQTGAWRWYGDQQVIYRPKDYWRPGTKLTITTPDQTVAATIGRKTTFQISDVTKQMQVLKDDKLVETFPVSLGAPETPSSSGNMLIMTREPSALWVYSADDQLQVSDAERLTTDGEYIHAAPWSVADQGHTDVSHGCTNLSPDNAAWVYNNSQIGDPVTVNGTAKHLDPGNGWTVWDMSWTDYLKGSALPQHAR